MAQSLKQRQMAAERAERKAQAEAAALEQAQQERYERSVAEVATRLQREHGLSDAQARARAVESLRSYYPNRSL